MERGLAARWYLFVAFMALWTLPSLAWGQIRPSRTQSLLPILRPDSVGALAGEWMQVEMQRGWGSTMDEQAWQLRLHAGVALWRIDTATTLAFTAHHELTASPFSSIGFNPRTARWEEQLMIQRQLENLVLTAGAFHRCKHDVDNNEPPDDDTSRRDYIPTRRAIVLSGLAVRADWLPNANTIMGAGIEWNALRGDYRTPGGTDPGSWNAMAGVITLRATHALPLSAHASIVGRAWAGIPLFTDGRPLAADARAEVVLRLRRVTTLEICASVDHQFDDVVFLNQGSTTVWQIGLRIGGG